MNGLKRRSTVFEEKIFAKIKMNKMMIGVKGCIYFFKPNVSETSKDSWDFLGKSLETIPGIPRFIYQGNDTPRMTLPFPNIPGNS